MNDLQKQLSSTWIENKNCTVDGFGRKIAFKGLVDGHTVDIGIINKPYDLVGKQFGVILRG